MTYALLALILIPGAVLQIMLPAVPVLGYVKLPVLMAIVVYYALNHRRDVMFVAAVLAGFLQDSLSPMPLGYSSAVFCVLGWGMSYFRGLVISEVGITYVVFGAVGGACTELVLWGALAYRELLVLPAGRVLLRAQGAALLGAICTPFIFFIVRRIDHLVGNVATREDFIGHHRFYNHTEG